MESLVERMELRLAPLGAESRKMFGGTCFMLRGNMLAGAFRGELMVRLARNSDTASLAAKGARRMEMRGKPMAGFWLVPEAAIDSSQSLDYWLEMALNHNETLPPNAARKRKSARKRM